jgi:hypothetical protein
MGALWLLLSLLGLVGRSRIRTRNPEWVPKVEVLLVCRTPIRDDHGPCPRTTFQEALNIGAKLHIHKYDMTAYFLRFRWIHMIPNSAHSGYNN